MIFQSLRNSSIIHHSWNWTDFVLHGVIVDVNHWLKIEMIWKCKTKTMLLSITCYKKFLPNFRNIWNNIFVLKQFGTFFSSPLNLCQISHRQHFEETTFTMSNVTTRSNVFHHYSFFFVIAKIEVFPHSSFFPWNRPEKLETKKIFELH